MIQKPFVSSDTGRFPTSRVIARFINQREPICSTSLPPTYIMLFVVSFYNYLFNRCLSWSHLFERYKYPYEQTNSKIW